MHSREIMRAIDELSAAKGKDKEGLLDQYLRDEKFRRVLTQTYDPFITYGVKKIEIPDTQGELFFTADTFDLLFKLSSRKLTGNAAKQAIQDEMEMLEENSQELLKRILTKDVRAGFTATLINKVRPDTIYVFKCMLSHKYEEKRIKAWPVAVETKLDGVRCLAVPTANGYKLYSRTGKEFLNYEHITDKLNMSACDVVLDGEIVDKSGSFNKTAGDAHRKGQQASDAVFTIFDILPFAEFMSDSVREVYAARRNNLLQCYADNGWVFCDQIELSDLAYALNDEEVQALNAEVQANGGEGVIVKPLDGLYNCKRSYAWLKIKGYETFDIPIIGFKEGTGKYEGMLGAALADFNGVEVSVSGFTDSARDEIWSNQSDFLGRLMEVGSHEVTPDGSLRHPRFIRWRDDKPVSDGVGV